MRPSLRFSALWCSLMLFCVNSFLLVPPCRPSSRLANAYDDWRSNGAPTTMPLDEGNVRHCLQLLIESQDGQSMFGCHARPSEYDITGDIEFVEVDGPTVVLSLTGRFWHRRETVLARAAVWLNACMPEIVQVRVEDPADLDDFEEIRDEVSGEVVLRKDKRAPDFNGDRSTMEYQGMDPDVRGPFPSGPLSPGGSMISPS